MTASQFHATPGVEEWRVIGDGACSFFRTGSFEVATRLVDAISRLPGIEEHQPDIDIRPDGVTVRLLTSGDDYYGMSSTDVDLAQRISAAAHDLNLVGDPSRVQSMLVVPGVRNVAEVMPFLARHSRVRASA